MDKVIAAPSMNHAKIHRVIVGLNAQKDLLLEEISKTNDKNLQKEKEEEIKKIDGQIKNFEEKITSLEKTLKSASKLERQPVYYSDYIAVDELLNSQKLESAKYGEPIHDEMLFIIIHQTYELWFKQILHEFIAVINMLSSDYVPEKNIGTCVHHLGRVIEIQKVLLDQLSILDTMTALDFMDFRDYLYPASGFQSFQFRLIENRFGMLPDKRVQYERKAYHTRLAPEHQKIVQEAEGKQNLFQAVEKWLERTPFLKTDNFDFLKSYKEAAEKMFNADKDVILHNTEGTKSEEREQDLKKWEENRDNFRALFDEKAHNEQIEGGRKRLSFAATQAALLIFIYQDEPIFSLPFRMLNYLVDIDELLTRWRFKHAMMVHRKIGTKLGTGGSSGYWYLKSTVERGRVFADIGNLPSYLIPRKDLPEIPIEVRKNFGFAIDK